VLIRWIPPRSRDTYLWADFVELLCLTSPDGFISRSDLLDRLHDSRDLGEVTAIEATPPREDEDALDSDLIATTELVDVGPAKGTVLLASDVFDHIAYRATLLGASYPFRLRKGRSAIDRKRIVRKHHLYLFLLLAASLPRIPKKWYPVVTRSFERTVEVALRRWLPSSAKVHVFGTSGSATSRYRGRLYAKLTLLSSDLAERLLVTEDDLRRTDVGDTGADVVAWLSLGDKNSSRLIILAQAACGLNWVKKQHESGGETWNEIMRFTAPHTNVVAIPYFFRRNNGDWAAQRKIHGSVLIDRPRLMWLFRRALPDLPRDALKDLIASRVALV